MAMAISKILNPGAEMTQATLNTIAAAHKKIYKRELNTKFVAQFFTENINING